MIVKMWMSKNVVTVHPGTLTTDAAALMVARNIRRLPVVSANEGRLVGIVSMTDLLHSFPPDVNPLSVVASWTYQTESTVGGVMSRRPVTTTPDAPIEEAARIMRDRKIGSLPVLQEDTLVGLITQADIFRAFVELFELNEGEARITFDGSRREDALRLVVEAAWRRSVRVVSVVSSHHDGQPVCLVRVAGSALDSLLGDLLESGHQVLNVVRA